MDRLIPAALTDDLCCPNTVMARLVRALRLRPVRCRMARPSRAMTVKELRVSAKGRWYYTAALIEFFEKQGMKMTDNIK
jgi:hypothetical protein